MTWPVQFDRERISLSSGRVSAEDGERQMATVEAILDRLHRQPGVVLADEVGMGKTFVALAVAVSVAWAERHRRTVVVMVPPSLREKWPREFEVFRSLCIRREKDQATARLRAKTARSGVDFFKLLDDPGKRRPHIIFLPHGALYRSLQDPWIKLAILRQALRVRRFAQHRRAFHRFAAETLQLKSRFRDPEFFRHLLGSRPAVWRDILQDWDVDSGDDPVPEAIIRVLNRRQVDLSALREALNDLPLRRSRHLKERLQDVRRALTRSLQRVWQEALVQARFRSPLLILDEAHHLKNPATRLASLFVQPEAEEEARLLMGALAGRFDRMLFLTATPFQLGHHELLNVLDRFRGIRWPKRGSEMDRDAFNEEIRELRKSLDQAQLAAAHLDSQWGLLTEADVGTSGDGTELERWWQRASAEPGSQSDRVQVVLRAYGEAKARMREAEVRLRPWVIRHLRPRTIPQSDVPRRETLPGAAILHADGSDRLGKADGLPIRDDALLPFLLAARSQALATWSPNCGHFGRSVRPTFAEGLASSYEAFLHTRTASQKRQPVELLDEDVPEPHGAVLQGQALNWYLERLNRSLPRRKAYAGHPKLGPTVRRALALWEQGEKVLVFCHFRATGRALSQHLSSALDDHILSRAQKAFRCNREEAVRRLENLGERFDPGRPLYRQLEGLVKKIVGRRRALSSEERSAITDVIRRFVRTAPFLVRHFPLEAPDSHDAFEQAVAKRDASGLSLREKLEGFVTFLSDRCTPDERNEFLQALDRIQTGVRYIEERLEEGDGTVRVLPNVRLVNGLVSQADRRRVLLAFNTPFFPEVLVASSVLAEGVDLHLSCRYLVHHDLSWNPSTIEQRTGRVDRIGAKAERVRKPISVYLPYVAGTQDEKMYRIVRDRERWFQVLMGEKYAVDERVTSKLEQRVPLPEQAAQELAFRLGVQREDERFSVTPANECQSLISPGERK